MPLIDDLNQRVRGRVWTREETALGFVGDVGDLANGSAFDSTMDDLEKRLRGSWHGCPRSSIGQVARGQRHVRMAAAQAIYGSSATRTGCKARS